MSIEKSKPKKKDGRADNGGAREGAGRPAFEPTDDERKQVEAMSGYGLPVEQIAILIRGGISIDTLYKYFGDEMTAGKAKANAKVGQTLFQKAMAGDTAAAIWWSKARMRWKEKVEHEHTGAGGGPLKTETTVILEPSEAYKRMLGGGSD